MSLLAVTGVGALATGEIAAPLRTDVDTLVCEDGLVRAMGGPVPAGADVLDVGGATVAPGLIDSHVHVVFGDYTPRQQTVGFLESYVHGGITRALSASEVHLPGRPTDPAGVKALALVAHRSWSRLRPLGMTVHGGAIILEPGLQEDDFAELAAQGLWLAKAGMGAFHPAGDAEEVVRAAQRQGFKVMCHTGGVSIPDSSPVSADDLLRLRPDVSGHVNGGTTALPDGDLPRVVDSGIALQICQAGNLRSALEVVRLAGERDALGRVLAASDTPTGTGTMPLAVLKTVAELASLGGVAPEVALCFATGNVGRAYGLDAGVLAEGRPADLVVLDAPMASAAADALEALRLGDLPGIGAVVTSGELRVLRSRNTPPPTRMPQLTPASITLKEEHHRGTEHRAAAAVHA